VALSEEQRLAAQLGSTLAQVRAGSGYTQEQVADALGVTVETISRFERGAVVPPLLRLAQLADVYEVPIARLLRKEPVPASDLAEELMGALARLNEADRLWVGQWLTELCERLGQDDAPTRTPPRRMR
jgi:transcriptional regulator with XRE-family HTH domain